MNLRDRVEDAIENGYSMDHGAYISKAWETFKEGAGLFIGLLLISFIISFFLAFIPLIGPLANQLLISPVILLGYSIIAYKINKKEPYSFENGFDGFKDIGPIIIVNLLTMIVFILFAFFAGIFGFFSMDLTGGGINGGLVLLVLGFFLIAMYIYMSLRWAIFLVYFGKYNATEALSTSFQLIKQNILGHILLLILMFIFAITGAIALFIGLLITIPLAILIDFHAFEDITGLLLEEEEEDYTKFNTNEDFL